MNPKAKETIAGIMRDASVSFCPRDEEFLEALRNAFYNIHADGVKEGARKTVTTTTDGRVVNIYVVDSMNARVTVNIKDEDTEVY